MGKVWDGWFMLKIVELIDKTEGGRFIETPVGNVSHIMYSNGSVYLGEENGSGQREAVVLLGKETPFSGYLTDYTPFGVASEDDLQPSVRLTIDGQEGVNHVTFGPYLRLNRGK